MNTRLRTTVSKKAILLDGSQANDNTGERVSAALMIELATNGWDVERVILRERRIGDCGGDFYCWVKHPGTCMLDDDNRVIAEALVKSDLTVYLTPVTFGGYSSTLKRMVDHQIQNVSPFFAKIEGETHHHRRYRKNPDLLTVGWMDAPDEQSAAVFRHLVWRNAINWHAKTVVSGVVLAAQSDGEMEASAQKWLDEVQRGNSSQRVELPKIGDRSTAAGAGAGRGLVDVRRALLLVGSPKTRRSTSNSLGGYLFEQLSARSIQTETTYVHRVLRSPEKTQALLDAVDAADLVTLAFPLYVDSLPAPVIEALELIASHRVGRDRPRRQLLTAIANCGFPEADHCDSALALCEIFARQAGFEWAGALALGAGGMVNGFPLAEGGGKTIVMRKSLDLAAERLAQGQVIPEEAQDLLRKPIVPPWAYRLMGGLGWIRAAQGYSAARLLRRKPYLARVK
jgi:multimeric flavodoxin WrbA